MTLNKQRQLLIERESACIDALLAIYRLQTDSERRHDATFVLNGIGFNAYHAKKASAIAKILLDGRQITESETAYVREIMPRYAKQMRNLTNGNLSRMMK